MTAIPSTISASKARSNFYSLLDAVANKLQRITITHRGEEKVVLMHPEEVASWEETMEIISDPKLVRQILASEQERKNNRAVNEEALLENLKISPQELE